MFVLNFYLPFVLRSFGMRLFSSLFMPSIVFLPLLFETSFCLNVYMVLLLPILTLKFLDVDALFFLILNKHNNLNIVLASTIFLATEPNIKVFVVGNLFLIGSSSFTPCYFLRGYYIFQHLLLLYISLVLNQSSLISQMVYLSITWSIISSRAWSIFTCLLSRIFHLS